MATEPSSTVTEPAETSTRPGHREIPESRSFRDFIASGWASRSSERPARAEVAEHAARRREALSAQFPGQTLVVPAGGLKVRSFDTDFTFRAHTAYAYLTGFGSDAEPDSVLVMEPQGEGHDALLFLRPPSPVESEEFFSDPRYGEFWIGPRPNFDAVEARLDVQVRDLADLLGYLPDHDLRVVADAAPQLTSEIDSSRLAPSERPAPEPADVVAADEELARFISGMRAVKDGWEVDELRLAVAATKNGFEEMIRGLSTAVDKGRGERWVEGLFGLHARHEGNTVGYESICAAGDHATVIHWTRNDGDVSEGDLILIDAGIEVDSLYTADITRTLPINGRFSDPQREIYNAVLEAQEAGMAAVKPGNKFSDIHKASIRVIAQKLLDWGLLPDGVSLEDTLDPETGGWHRRWMVHGTSHHLGLDVHDCGLLLRADYMDAELRPGMVVTVEPGLYFKGDDLLAPEEFRRIGVRIEDDVLVTADGYENLSAALPRTAEDVEAWMAEQA